MANYVAITAGGVGKRMKSDTAKSFIELRGKPLVIHVLDAFESVPEVDKIVIVVRTDLEEELMEAVRKSKSKKFAGTIESGAERQDSVWNGIKKAEEVGAKEEDVILIHSACNPFIKPEEISACIKAAEEFGASVAAMPSKDTVHLTNEEKRIVETPIRKNVFLAQTPQCGKLGLLKKAFEKAFAEKFYGTDEMQLLGRIGVKGKIVECSYENIKITTPEDLKVAEKILEAHESAKN
ncbi:MAG: 2-C-methyl-D-erythritol 4-phosphate cytidylyltransferase [archaeon]